MKNLICLLLVMLLGSSVKAQIFTPSVGRGVILGATAGAIIGHNTGSHNTGRGALIGAIAGGLISSISDTSCQDEYQYRGGPFYRQPTLLLQVEPRLYARHHYEHNEPPVRYFRHGYSSGPRYYSQPRSLQFSGRHGSWR